MQEDDSSYEGEKEIKTEKNKEEIIKEYLSDASDINSLTDHSDSAYKQILYENLYLWSSDSSENI